MYAIRSYYDPIPVRLEVPVAAKANLDSLLALEVRSQTGQRVPISEIATVQETGWDDAVYHKDLLPVVMVMGDMAGKLDSPLYGMFELSVITSYSIHYTKLYENRQCGDRQH